MTARSVMEWAGYGTVDGAVVHAVSTAHRAAADDLSYTDARMLGSCIALNYADYGGPEVVGAFLMAYMSTLSAIELEIADMRKAFGAVADEWWQTHPRGVSYGAPWSPRVPDALAVTASVLAQAVTR